MSSETNEPTAGEREAVERFEAVTDTALAQLSLDELLRELLVRVQRIPVGAGFVGRVAAEQRPVVIEHVVRAQLAHPVLRESGIRSLLGVPILFEGRGIG